MLFGLEPGGSADIQIARRADRMSLLRLSVRAAKAKALNGTISASLRRHLSADAILRPKMFWNLAVFQHRSAAQAWANTSRCG
jgi:hypothetical protein